jgi:anti-anti-sigma factor
MTNWKKLQTEELTQGPVLIFRLRGVLTSSTESYTFLEKIQDLVHAGSRHIVINMEQVDPLTSAGVGVLAACFTSVTNAGGKISLVKVPDRAKAVLKVVHLYELMGDCADEAEAVGRVSP